MLVLGSLPKAVAAAAKKFGPGAQLAVDLESDDHLPAVEQWAHRAPPSSYVALPRDRRGRCRRLQRRGYLEHDRLPQRGRQHLHPHGQAVVAGPERHAIAGCPARLEGIVQTSLRYMVSGSAVLAPRANAVPGAVGEIRTSKDRVGLLEVAEDQGADPLGLAVVGVVSSRPKGRRSRA